MLNKITELQRKNLGNPKAICILRFENQKDYNSVIEIADIMSPTLPCELLYDIEGNGDAVPFTIVIPADRSKELKIPIERLGIKFEITEE